MNSSTPIGGYFEWEFPLQKEFTLHKGAVFLNSGRHALEYILRGLKNVSRVFVPYYTCDAVIFPLDSLHIPYTFYHINECFEIADEIELNEDEYIIYTNYFGIKDTYIKKIVDEYADKVIVDNAQALYCPAYACHQIYSPRKYMGMPDGGLAVTTFDDYYNELPQGLAFDRCNHLLKRIELMPFEGYNDFKKVSLQITSSPLSKMSEISRKILCSVDFDTIKKRRFKNFKHLHEALVSTNGLGDLLTRSIADSCSCPMAYPYWTNDSDLKSRLIKEQIFVATYWPNVLNWTKPDMIEYEFTKNLLAIPCDQRYDEEDMNRIIQLICKYQ